MEIRKCLNNNGVGVFASISYTANTIVHGLCGQVYTQPTQTTIEIGPGRHIEDTTCGIYMNHSFGPTCKIKNSYIVALVDIQAGDELTFNYNENETTMSVPFLDETTHMLVSGKPSRTLP